MTVLELRDAAYRHPGQAMSPGISLSLQRGEILAVCGASGAGKTTLARLIARLIPLRAGDILLHGQSIGQIAPQRFARDPRRPLIQMVFQEAAASFPPRQTCGSSIAQALARFGPANDDLSALAGRCGLAPGLLDRLPAHLSQGQLARAALVRALVLRPQVLVLDEPTAALDAPVQAGVLHLLDALRREGLAQVLITHDLHIARLLADRIAVMEAGRIVEIAPPASLLADPRHPASRALVAAMV